MRSTYKFAANISDDGHGSLLVSMQGIPEALTDAPSMDEARINAVDMLEEAIAARIEDKQDIPSSANEGEHLIEVPVLTAMKAALYERMRENKVSNVQLADALGIDEKAVRRFIDPRHNTKVEALEKALRHLGVKVSAHFSRI